MSPTETGQLREEIETWFIHCGLPSFVTDPREHLPFTTRVIPVLSVVYLLESFTALNFDRSVLGNLLGLAAAFFFLIAVSWLVGSIPEKHWLVGAIPFTRFIPLVFIAAPVLIGLSLGEGLPVAISVLGLNAVMLFVAGYGGMGISKEAGSEIKRQLRQLVNVLPGAAPSLLLFLTFLFVQAEVWQTVAQLDGLPLFAVLLLFPLITTLFASAYVTKDVAKLARFATWEEVRQKVFGTVAEPLCDLVPESASTQQDLSDSEKVNASFLMRFAVMLRSFAVGMGVSLFFVGLGAVLVSPEVAESWMQASPNGPASTNYLWTPILWGNQMGFSEELIQVSLFMGAFAGMYFSWFTLSDKDAREDFFGDIDQKMRQLLAARSLYKAYNWDSQPTEKSLSRFGSKAVRVATGVKAPGGF